MNQTTTTEFAQVEAGERSVLPIDLRDGLSLDWAEARRIGEELSASYCFAEPFPHIVLDNFLPPAMARMALDNFPQDRLKSDHVFEMGYAGLHKRQILPDECNANARGMFHFFNSRPMLEFLEGLSTIESLIPDPHFAGGGFHETGRDGKLGIHADFRINERLHLHRRMNLIVYLNEDWKDEYGGFLELWDRKMTKSEKSVKPVFNRCVIFNTDADSYHGHPDPMPLPDGVFRRSMALYYYTASRKIYDEVPNHGTMYQARPGDDQQNRQEVRSLKFEQVLRQWTPPALLRTVLKVRHRLTGK
jgi:2-oxoglutarate-Fe(II)-dependent oxygenase superfamily protein